MDATWDACRVTGANLQVISTPQVKLQATSQQNGMLQVGAMLMYGRNTDGDAGQKHHAHGFGATLHLGLPCPCRHFYGVVVVVVVVVVVFVASVVIAIPIVRAPAFPPADLLEVWSSGGSRCGFQTMRRSIGRVSCLSNWQSASKLE
jgi:hypothetical protein